MFTNCLSKLRPVFKKKMDQSGGMDMVWVVIYTIRCLISFTTGSLLRSDGGKVKRNERMASIFCLVCLSIYVTIIQHASI